MEDINQNKKYSTSSDSSTSSTESEVQDMDVESNNLLPRSKGRHEEKQPARHNGGCRLEMAAFLISCFCLVSLVGSISWMVFREINLFWLDAAKTNSRVCLPCIQVNPSPFEEKPSPYLQLLDKTLDTQNDTEICCAHSAAQYAALFQLILQRQQEVKKLADIVGRPSQNAGCHQKNGPSPERNNSDSVSAHLLFQPPMPTHRDNSIQRWKSPDRHPTAHIRDGLKLWNNNIYVEVPGLYFVYCQIFYNRAESPEDQVSSVSQIVSNYVKRNSLAYPSTSGILLKARHTRLPLDRHSSYVAGLFFLHRGDSLFTQVSHPAYISHDETGSFFGLYKVSD